MISGPEECCLDWFVEYPAASETDPVGPENRKIKTVTEMILVQNWLEELKRLCPTGKK